MQRPSAARPGSTLGVFAPSSPFDAERFEKGAAVLESLGYRVARHAQLDARHGYLAGKDDDRVSALHALLEDPTIDAVIAARGGYGAHRFLRELDPELIRRANKPIVGFSDVSAIHSVVQGRAHLASIHGPVVTQLAGLGPEDHRALVLALSGAWSALRYTSDHQPITGGRVTGTLTGGCLSVVAPLVGTDLLFLPEDAILLLEDVGEATYRVDRLLTHLRLAGVLQRVRGVAVGDFVGCEPQRAGEQTIAEVLADRLGDLGVPVLSGLPIGHGTRNRAVPLGARVTLDADGRTLAVDEEDLRA